VTFGADDAEAVAKKATEMGGTVLVPPFDAPWARITGIADPGGAAFLASQFAPENKDVGTQADASISAS
jgi:predicted enzyme related to lactoylglutathione lyase